MSNFASVGTQFSSANYTTTELIGVFELHVNRLFAEESPLFITLKNGTAMCKNAIIVVFICTDGSCHLQIALFVFSYADNHIYVLISQDQLTFQLAPCGDGGDAKSSSY